MSLSKHQPRPSSSKQRREQHQLEATKRRDFLDPDFDFRASLDLGGSKRRKNRCRIGTQAESEIPALGLDSGRLEVDCRLDPARVADAAIRVAQKYRKRNRKGSQPAASIKKKRTRISIDREYERSKGRLEPAEDEEDTDEMDSADAPSRQYHRRHPSEASQLERDEDEELDDD